MLANRRQLPPLVFFAIGGAGAIVGLLPWIITGMRLPLQNLWATSTLPGDMPIALLPFSQYYLVFIASLILVGSAVSGIAGRALSSTKPSIALIALLSGTVVVQAAATAQTTIVVGLGLSERSEASFYLFALVIGISVTIAVGLGILALIARAPRAGAVLALSIGAIALSTWLGRLVYPVGTLPTDSPFRDLLLQLFELTPSLAIGAAIAWSGINTIGRIISAIASLVLLWVGPSLVTAISAAAGSRVLLRYPAEVLDYAIGVFRMAVAMPELRATSLIIAIVVAAAGLLAKRIILKPTAATADQS